MEAENGAYNQTPTTNIEAGTVKSYEVPHNSDSSATYVLRVTDMAQTFADTDTYEYTGMRVAVGDTVYNTLIPAQPSSSGTYDITDEVSVRIRTSGAFDLKVTGCTGYENITLTAVYVEKQGGSTKKTPQLSYEPATASEYVTVAWIENTDAGSLWKLTMAEGSGYALESVQLVQNEQTKVMSEDGASIEWVVAEDGAAYIVVIQPITITLGDLYLQTTTGRSEIGCWNGTAENGSVFEGQRVALMLGRVFNYTAFELQNEVTYKFYAGTDTSTVPLKEAVFVTNSKTGGSKEYEDSLFVYVILDPMPALENITVTAQVANGEIISKTYDVNIPSSGKTDMTWLSVPSSGPYPTESKAAISGPNVYGSAAFRNAETGEISLYLAVSGGVMQYTMTGTTSLVYMDGMSFGYYDNEDVSGHAIALGGASESDLTALVKKVTGSYTTGLNTSYCLYRCNSGTWQEVSGSALSTPHSFGLVLASNNVWVSDQHWNGTSWVANDVTFNSFWKSTDGTAYAGSANGIYKYTDSKWTAVSGVTGTAYISSGCRNADGSVTLILSEKMEIEGANQWYNMNGGTIRRAVVSGTSASVTQINVSAIAPSASSTVYVGVAADGAIYGITAARIYELAQFTSYQGSYLYKYENGAWVYQNVDAFNNATDKTNIAAGKLLGSIETPKQQPDGIRHIENPIEGVTIFAGQGGGNYIMFSTATISFESNGGSAVEPITQTIGSAVTPPASPKRDGFTFSGWYLSDRDIAMGNAPYSWTVMPASDLTLYAKWTESSGESGDPFATEKENAKNSLATTLGRLKESDYEASVWQQIQAAYNSGVAAIAAATTYDGVYAALNNAVDELNELAKNTSGTITVAVTIEKLTVDGTYIIEPTLLTVNKYERASVVVTDLLKQYYASAMPVADGFNGNPYRITGTETSNFYLAGIYDPSFNPAAAGSSGQNAIGEEFVQNHAGFLSEFDGGQQSGWLYCVNGTFPGVGASAWTLVNGDVLRWQYTCTGLGSDVGADNSAWGDDTHVTVANKDALIWKIANINHDGTKAKYGEAYTDAMTALQTITATQAAVDAALAALNAVDAAEEQAAADLAAARAVDTEIEAIGEVTLESVGKITAARAAYEALTDTQKALVTKLSVLTAAETAYAELKAAADQAAVDAAAAKSVKELIEAIGEVSLDKEADITAARAAYNGLTEAQKALVTNLSDLTAAETKLAELKADKAAAEAVDGKIDAIGTVTLESESKITEARTAYDALSAAQKALVTKLPALAAAEETLAGLKADKAAAEAVETKITAIGEVTLESETAITEARAAYDALTDAQKALVSNLATLTAAESRLAELKNGGEPVELTWQTALESVLAYLRGKVTNPGVGTLEGEWAVLAMNRGGAATDAWNNIYIENLKTFVDNCGGVLDTYKYTEYSRVILALTAAGVDASEFATDTATYDLVKPLLDKQSSGAYMAEKQGNNGTMFALIALNTHDYLNTAEGKAARAALIASLKANQLESGAWAISGKTSPDLDVTAAGIYALAPYYLDEAKLTALGGTVTYAELKTMVESALAYLSGRQNASGGFGSVEADVWAIIALSSIGRDADTDADFVKANGSLLQDMLSYFDRSTGAFRHLLDGDIDQMATEQAAYGLVAYERYKTGNNPLYDMNDVPIASLEEKAKQAQADEVDELIAAIGEVSLESKAKIDAARAAYDALTAEVKAKVTKLSVLEAAEAEYKRLADAADQEKVDQAAAKGADDLIADIGEVSLESESAITAARTAYDALTEAQKKLVTKLDVLTAAEAKLTELKADKAAAETVDKQIGNLGEVTKESEEAIKAARASYDALTDAQKALVTKLSVLTAAEEKLAALNGGSTEKKITVTMRLIGAELATKDVDLGAEAYLPNYVTWIPTTTYELKEGATVYDLWILATADWNISSIGADSNYVKTVYAPEGYALSEFTNGARSGWMYTVNGSHPGYGLKEQKLNNGDVVIWHYINDYSYESADWISEGPWQALGDGTYYNQWLKAPDYAGGVGGGVSGSGSGSGSGSSGGSGSGTVTETEPEGVTRTETTVEGDDGSTSTTVTETSSETVTNEDGSVTETNTEKVTETVTDVDGSVTKSETVTENETTTNTVENTDGSTTETAATTETVTETVTAEDGSKAVTETATETKVETTTTENEDGSTTVSTVTETKETSTITVTDAEGNETTSVVETTETRTVETTVDAEGKVTGSGTVSSSATVTDVNGEKSTVVTEGTVTVDTDDRGTVSEVTTAKTTTTAADGTKTEATTVTTDSVAVDGCTGTVVEDENGKTLSAEATVSEEALNKALETGEPVSLPVSVNPTEDEADAPMVSVYLPYTEEETAVDVEIEVKLEGPGVVALIRQPSGALSVDSKCRTGSVIVSVSGNCDIVIVDNSKYFSDVEAESWYKDSVTFVTAREIFNGYDTGAFGPNDKMNRAMAAQIIYNLEKGKPVTGNQFSDVAADAWYAPAVGWAAENVIVTGADGAYRPLENITRQDLVVILYRYAKMAKYDRSIDREVILSNYVDGTEVASYAADAMRWAITQGLITGYEDGSLRPKNTATRAEVAAIMQRLIQNVVR